MFVWLIDWLIDCLNFFYHFLYHRIYFIYRNLCTGKIIKRMNLFHFIYLMISIDCFFVCYYIFYVDWFKYRIGSIIWRRRVCIKLLLVWIILISINIWQLSIRWFSCIWSFKFHNFIIIICLLNALLDLIHRRISILIISIRWRRSSRSLSNHRTLLFRWGHRALLLVNYTLIIIILIIFSRRWYIFSW